MAELRARRENAEKKRQLVVVTNLCAILRVTCADLTGLYSLIATCEANPLAQVVLYVALVNVWNRVNVTTRQVPGANTW